jgi:hypothetical protein
VNVRNGAAVAVAVAFVHSSRIGRDRPEADFNDFSKTGSPMTPEVKYERIAKFVFGSCRHGGDIADVYNWMADELGVAHPDKDDRAATAGLQADYFDKFVSDEQFSDSHRRFMKIMCSREV